MISEVLAEAIEGINRDLSNPNLNWIHTGHYLRIIQVRQAMYQLSQELEEVRLERLINYRGRMEELHQELDTPTGAAEGE